MDGMNNNFNNGVDINTGMPNNMGYNEYQVPQQPKKKKTVVIVCVIIALLLMCCCCAPCGLSCLGVTSAGEALEDYDYDYYDYYDDYYYDY